PIVYLLVCLIVLKIPKQSNLNRLPNKPTVAGAFSLRARYHTCPFALSRPGLNKSCKRSTKDVKKNQPEPVEPYRFTHLTLRCAAREAQQIMAIPQHTIDQILDRTDIVDVIGQFVKLKKTGRTYSGCCPFHQEKSPSFHVYRDKQYFHCFGCQANGNAIRFLMDIGSRNFVEVMKDLSSQTGIELAKDNTDSNKLKYKREAAKPKIVPAQAAPQTQPQQNSAPTENNNAVSTTSFDPFAEFQTSEQDFYGDPFASFEHLPMAEVQQDGNLYDLLENIAQFYERQLPNSPSAQQYFKQRGLTAETIAYWRLGYAPEDWQHLEKAFPQDIEGLKLLGLIRTSDSGRDFDLLRERVIFPIRDTKGRVVGFGGRALNDEIKPKYINSPDSE